VCVCVCVTYGSCDISILRGETCVCAFARACVCVCVSVCVCVHIRLAQVRGWDDVRGRRAERLFHVIGSIPGFDPCHWVGLPAQRRVCFFPCPLLGRSWVG
jgi:hypothetical protein